MPKYVVRRQWRRYQYTPMGVDKTKNALPAKTVPSFLGGGCRRGLKQTPGVECQCMIDWTKQVRGFLGSSPEIRSVFGVGNMPVSAIVMIDLCDVA